MLAPKMLKEISVEVENDDMTKVLHTPMNRNPGMWETAAAVAQANFQHTSRGVANQFDPNYDFNNVKEEMGGKLTNPEYQRIFKNADVHSQEEADNLYAYFENMEYITKKAGAEGTASTVGLVLGHVADSAIIPGIGGAYAVGKAFKGLGAATGAYRAMRGVGATAGEARFAVKAGGLAAESIGFDVGYTVPKMMADQNDMQNLQDNLAIGLAVTSGMVVAAPAMKAVATGAGDLISATTRAVANGNNPINVFSNSAAQVRQANQAARHATANPGDEIYVKEEAAAHGLQAPSRFSQTYGSESQTLNDAQARLFTDSTTGKTDVDMHIQATAADNDVDKWVSSTLYGLGEDLTKDQKAFLKSAEGKVWKQKYGVSTWDRVLHKPIADRMGYQIHRAMATGTVDQLPVGLQKMAEKINKAQKDTFEMMKRYGVKGTENLDHADNYIARLHDPDEYIKLMRHNGRDVKAGEAHVLDILEESIFRGAAQAGAPMARPLARRIAYILQHRVLAQGKDKFALEEFLTSPNAMYRHSKAHGLSDADALDLTRQAFNDVTWNPGQAAKKSNPGASSKNNFVRLRHRIPMDLSVKVQGMVNKWGDEFQVSDLMVNDAFGTTGRYVRRGMGNAAMAKRGWKSPDEIEAMLSKVREEMKYAANREKAATQMLRFENGINRIMGTTAFEETTGAMSRLAMVSGILGKHSTGVMLGGAGIAALGEVAKVVNRTGFKAILDLVPALRNADDKKLLEQMREYGYYIGNSRMFSRFDHIEDYGTNAFGVAGALATQSAQATLRFSGLSLIDKMSRQAALIGFTNKLVKQIRKGRVNSRDFKLSEMGWKPATFDKIKAHIRAHGMNMDDWRLPNGHQDLETIEAFTSGAHKVVSENVTRPFHGETNDFIDGPVGSMFLQFRKILYQTYNKALIKGLAHRDAIAATNLVAGLFSALFVSELRSAAKTAGMDEKEKDEYYNKYNLRHAIMNEGDLMQAFVHTMSYSAEFGGSMEALSLFSGPVLGVELSGRSTSVQDTIFSAPSLSLAENILRSGGHVISSPFTDEPDWEDARRRAWASTTAHNWYLFPYIYRTFMAPEAD